MKTTPFEKYHLEAGAKMLEFAGYNMPIRYSSINDEHFAVRKDAGMFDVSHMGEFVISGKEAKKLVNYIITNDANKLENGKVLYTTMCYENGTVVDDLLVYQFTDEKFLLVVNASNIQKDFEWIKSNNKFDAQLEDKSDAWALLAIQGPNCESYMQDLTDVKLSEIEYYTYAIGKFADCDNVLISATGYTGERGFELYLRKEFASKIWEALKGKNIPLCGLACRDTLRLEMGYALYGNDIDATTTPLEANLNWLVKLKTKEDFIGKEALVKQKKEGLTRKLKGFILKERGVARKDYLIYDKQHNQIGKVTSGTMSPCLEKGIGMGYISSAHKDNEILIEVRKKYILAELTSLPFYK